MTVQLTWNYCGKHRTIHISLRGRLSWEHLYSSMTSCGSLHPGTCLLSYVAMMKQDTYTTSNIFLRVSWETLVGPKTIFCRKYRQYPVFSFSYISISISITIPKLYLYLYPFYIYIKIPILISTLVSISIHLPIILEFFKDTEADIPG